MAKPRLRHPANRTLLVFATEDGPARLTGQLRWRRGQRLLLEIGPTTVWVFEADATPDAVRRGLGLLFTMSPPEWTVEVDGKAVITPARKKGR